MSACRMYPSIYKILLAYLHVLIYLEFQQVGVTDVSLELWENLVIPPSHSPQNKLGLSHCIRNQGYIHLDLELIH